MAPDDLPPQGERGAPGTGPQGPRQTLAMRLAERNRQRELRAERLARLRAPGSPPGSGVMTGVMTGPAPGSVPDPVATEAASTEAASTEAASTEAASTEAASTGAASTGAASTGAASIEAAGAALEEFLRALTGDLPPLPEGPPVEPGELLPFQRPTEAAAPAPGDLDRLPGIGPGLIWALERSGLRCLADLAPLAPPELAARLGPLGRLVPADRWIAVARAAEGAT